MKMTNSLELQQSLVITSEMRQAIEMLAMNNLEIEALIDEELMNNPYLIENDEYRMSNSVNSFERVGNNAAYTVDFREHLIAQVGLGTFNAIERSIAASLIYNMNEDGILLEYDDIAALIVQELSVWPEWVESVRWRLMSLDPVGCAARSIKESMTHQARILFGPKADHIVAILSQSGEIAKNPRSRAGLLHMLGPKDYSKLKMLSPRPAQAYNAPFDIPNYWQPDLAIIKKGQGFYVTLLLRPSARLLINKSMGSLGHAYLSKCLTRAHFMVKSLRFREQSLRLVAHCIVNAQQEWFLSGKQLKPLTLHEIASASGLHESSVSRLVRNKYIATDRGVFELKYFFASAIKSVDDGEKHSSITIKESIKKLIKEEDPSCPESDEKLVSRLLAQGAKISRRTVAKYRLGLGLANAHHRRMLK